MRENRSDAKLLNLIGSHMTAHIQRTNLRKDQRRKHHHWQVTLYYPDGEKFARTYTDHKKANAFAERQRQSPVVKLARVIKVS
jgi:hypothetical protein